MNQEVIQHNKERAQKLKSNLCKFEYIGRFSTDGYAHARTEGDSTWCIIDIEGNILSETNNAYKYRGIINEGVTAVCNKEEKFGAIDIHGNVKVEFKYDYISDFYNGLAVARLGHLGGIINSNGDIILPIKYKVFAFDFIDGIGSFMIDVEDINTPKRVYIDLEGNELRIKANKYDYVNHFSVNKLLDQEPVIVKKISDIKLDGKTLHSFRDPITNTRCLFKIDNELIKTVYNLPFDKLHSDENIFSFRYYQHDEMYIGYYNIHGEAMIKSPEFDWMHTFRNGFGVLGTHRKENGRYVKRLSFMNRVGKLISTDYDYISPIPLERELNYTKDLANAYKGSYKGLINSNGEVLIPCKYNQITVIYHGIAACYDSNKCLTLEFF